MALVDFREMRGYLLSINNGFYRQTKTGLETHMQRRYTFALALGFFINIRETADEDQEDTVIPETVWAIARAALVRESATASSIKCVEGLALALAPHHQRDVRFFTQPRFIDVVKIRS